MKSSAHLEGKDEFEIIHDEAQIEMAQIANSFKATEENHEPENEFVTIEEAIDLFQRLGSEFDDGDTKAFLDSIVRTIISKIEVSLTSRDMFGGEIQKKVRYYETQLGVQKYSLLNRRSEQYCKFLRNGLSEGDLSQLETLKQNIAVSEQAVEAGDSSELTKLKLEKDYVERQLFFIAGGDVFSSVRKGLEDVGQKRGSLAQRLAEDAENIDDEDAQQIELLYQEELELLEQLKSINSPNPLALEFNKLSAQIEYLETKIANDKEQPYLLFKFEKAKLLQERSLSIDEHDIKKYTQKLSVLELGEKISSAEEELALLRAKCDVHLMDIKRLDVFKARRDYEYAKISDTSDKEKQHLSLNLEQLKNELRSFQLDEQCEAFIENDPLFEEEGGQRELLTHERMEIEATLKLIDCQRSLLEKPDNINFQINEHLIKAEIKLITERQQLLLLQEELPTLKEKFKEDLKNIEEEPNFYSLSEEDLQELQQRNESKLTQYEKDSEKRILTKRAQINLSEKRINLFEKIAASKNENLKAATVTWQKALEQDRKQNLESEKVEIHRGAKFDTLAPKQAAQDAFTTWQFLILESTPDIKALKKEVDIAEIDLKINWLQKLQESEAAQLERQEKLLIQFRDEEGEKILTARENQREEESAMMMEIVEEESLRMQKAIEISRLTISEAGYEINILNLNKSLLEGKGSKDVVKTIQISEARKEIVIAEKNLLKAEALALPDDERSKLMIKSADAGYEIAINRYELHKYESDADSVKQITKNLKVLQVKKFLLDEEIARNITSQESAMKRSRVAPDRDLEKNEFDTFRADIEHKIYANTKTEYEKNRAETLANKTAAEGCLESISTAKERISTRASEVTQKKSDTQPNPSIDEYYSERESREELRPIRWNHLDIKIPKISMGNSQYTWDDDSGIYDYSSIKIEREKLKVPNISNPEQPRAAKLVLIDPKSPGEAFVGTTRGNLFRVETLCYKSDKEIADTMAAIICKAAQKYGLSKDEAIEAINNAKKKGGADYIYNKETDSYTKSDADSEALKKFAGFFQRECSKHGIYSGRTEKLKSVTVGLRTAFVPKEVLEILSNRSNITPTKDDEKLLKQQSDAIKKKEEVAALGK